MKNAHQSGTHKSRNSKWPIIESWLPDLSLVVSQLVRRIEESDGRLPSTFKATVEGDLERFKQSIPEREFPLLSALPDLLGSCDVREFAADLKRITKTMAAGDPRYSLLLRLMSEADQQVPYVSMRFVLRHADPWRLLDLLAEPGRFLEDAERSNGEARAQAILHALRTIEPLYKPYLITLWELSYLRNRERPPNEAPSFGSLVNQTASRLSAYPGLVEADAGWRRNSAVHNPCEYIVRDDVVVMSDNNVPHTPVSVDELEVMVRRMYEISGATMPRVSQLYLFRLFSDTGLFKTIIERLPDLLSDDLSRRFEAEEVIQRQAVSLFGEVGAFFSEG
jgi:hypothetical protein